MSAGAPRAARRKAAPGDRDHLRVWLRLLRLTRGIEADLRERLRTAFGETLPRFDVMAALWKADEPISLTALSRMLMVSNGNVTGIIERLASEGHVRRVDNANDRRTSLVTLSAAGRTRFETIAAAHADWVRNLLAGLRADEAAAMIGMLERLSPRKRDRDGA